MADFTALRGIVCPVVSPCTSNEGVDYDSLQENLARLLRAPITGFYVCGGTGDGSRLTFAERCRTAELTIAQTKTAGRRTIVHVGQTLQRHALELAEHAMTLGADAVASVPPQGGWSETVAYYTALAAQAPVFIYYIPGLTHVSADYDQLRQLLDLPGVAEEIVGKAVAGRRADFVVATKLGMKVGDTPVDENTSPEAIRVQLRRSLRRINTDYIDLYYLHRYDPNTAPGEIARAIGEELKAGTIRAWGVSNYSAEQLSALLAAAREDNIPLPSLCQPPLSLLNTGALDALLPLCAQEGIGVIPYQVLQGGILTGKYHAGQQPPAGSRAAEKPDWMKPMTDEVYATLARVEAEAKAAGQSMTQYALAWALRQPAVRCVLLGVKRRAQLEEAAAIF